MRSITIGGGVCHTPIAIPPHATHLSLREFSDWIVEVIFHVDAARVRQDSEAPDAR